MLGTKFLKNLRCYNIDNHMHQSGATLKICIGNSWGGCVLDTIAINWVNTVDDLFENGVFISHSDLMGKCDFGREFL